MTVDALADLVCVVALVALLGPYVLALPVIALLLLEGEGDHEG